MALVAILVGVTGFEVPLPRFGGGPERIPLPGVRAAAASTLLKVGSGAPPGGELAFLAVEPNLFVATSVDRGAGFEQMEQSPDYKRPSGG